MQDTQWREQLSTPGYIGSTFVNIPVDTNGHAGQDNHLLPVKSIFHFIISLGAGEIFRQWRNFYWNFFNLPPKKRFLPVWKLKILHFQSGSKFPRRQIKKLSKKFRHWRHGPNELHLKYVHIRSYLSAIYFKITTRYNKILVLVFRIF